MGTYSPYCVFNVMEVIYLSVEELKHIYLNNKEVIEEIRINQKSQEKRLNNHEVEITKNKMQLEEIKNTLSKGNILKWNFAGIVVASLLTYLIQVIT